MEYAAPQSAGRDVPFRSAIREHLKGHTQGLEDLAIEMLARGLSVRDIEDAERVRDHLSVCGWHRRAFAAWRQTRAGSGGRGLYDRGPSRAGGRFETQWLAADTNLSALTDLSGRWIDLVHARTPPRGIVLDKLIKIGAKVVSHGRYIIFQMVRQMFQEILRLIAGLRPQPPPAL